MSLEELSSLVRLGRRTKVRPLAVFILDEFKRRRKIVCPILSQADYAVFFVVRPVFTLEE